MSDKKDIWILRIFEKIIVAILYPPILICLILTGFAYLNIEFIFNKYEVLDLLKSWGE